MLEGFSWPAGTTVTMQLQLGTTNSNLHTGILISGDYLYLNGGAGQFSSVNKNTGVLTGAQSFFYTLVVLSIAPAQNKIFGRDVGFSPADILQLQITANGGFGSMTDGPYYGDYAGAQRTYVSPINSAPLAKRRIILATESSIPFVLRPMVASSFSAQAASFSRSTLPWPIPYLTR